MRTAIGFFAMLALAAPLTACPGATSSAPPTACIELYDKCTLASGVLGVCNATDCPAGQREPCLVCRSQH